MLNGAVEPKRIFEFPLRYFRARVLHFDSIDSTNTFLKEYAQNAGHENLNPLEAVCALADEQTAGRGRMDRTWHSPRGEGLYFSILLRPELDAGNAPLLTLMAAIAAVEAVGTVCAGPLDIKWPNDILVGRRKVGGILTEASFDGSHLSYAVLGFGINLNQKYFPEEISKRATSLYLETQQMIDSARFLEELLRRIDHWYGVLTAAPVEIAERWQYLSSFAQGRLIRINLDGQEVRARTCGLEPCGALRAETTDGQIIILYGGEISVDEEAV